MAINLPFGISIGRNSTQTNPQRIPTAMPDETPIPPGDFNRRDPGREIGAVGTRNYAGFLDNEEYNADLKGDKALHVYNRMYSSDSMCGAMMRTIVLPLRGAIPKFEPASDDPKDIMIAAVCEQALLNMKGMPFDDYLRQAFTGTLQYGHSVFEQVYVDNEQKPNVVEVEHEGKTIKVVAPYKLAPRLQRTIYRWPTDRNGDLVGIVQKVFVGDLPQGTQLPAGGDENAAVSGGVYRYIPIPVDRLMVFVLEQDGSNFLGRSIYRSAYRDFYMKNTYINIQAIGFERHFVGTPYALLKQGIRGDEEDAIINMLQHLRSHEKGFATANEAQLADHTKTGMNPIGYLDMPSLGTSARAILDAIKYHDQQMAVSILADFLTMANGSGSNNSNAMHRDKSSLFFNSLQGVKRPFEDSYQQQVVIPFVDVNFGPQAQYPKFGLTSLETKDVAQWGRGLALMAQSGLLTPDPKLENQLREMEDLPLLPTDDDGEPVYPEGTHLPPPAGGLPGVGGLPPAPGAPGQTPPSPRPTEPPPGPSDDNPDTAPLSELTPEDQAALDELDMGDGTAELVDVEQLIAQIRREVAASVRPLADPPTVPLTPAALLALQRKLAAQLAANAQRVQDQGDDYSDEQFVKDGHGLLKGALASAFAIGLGTSQPGKEGDDMAEEAATNQEPYLKNFAEAVSGASDGGQLPSAAEILERAELYASQAWNAYQQGNVAAMPDDAEIYWKALDDGGTCDNCAALEEGSPYTKDTLPGYPGDGGFGDDTLCSGGPNCRCFLINVSTTGADDLSEKPLVLAEARCQQCKARGRPTGKLLGHNLNVGAQVYCSGCRQLVEVRQ